MTSFNRFNKIKRVQGFTLIELLVSVAIVGILASISVTAFNEYRTKAYNTSALSFVKEAEIAAEVIVGDMEQAFVNQFEETACYFSVGGGLTSCFGTTDINIGEYLGATKRDPLLNGSVEIQGAAILIQSSHCKGNIVYSSGGSGTQITTFKPSNYGYAWYYC